MVGWMTGCTSGLGRSVCGLGSQYTSQFWFWFVWMMLEGLWLGKRRDAGAVYTPLGSRNLYSSTNGGLVGIVWYGYWTLYMISILTTKT
ncbi:hypothetical protein F4779DRAFT_610920 [Xylariaceae sp. FL0662B]|nr:hypothetical protein F4779DRAFT_610920 [Xylariaceae sp. FL0662B]